MTGTGMHEMRGRHELWKGRQKGAGRFLLRVRFRIFSYSNGMGWEKGSDLISVPGQEMRMRQRIEMDGQLLKR